MGASIGAATFTVRDEAWILNKNWVIEFLPKKEHDWLVVSTHLKNISQIGSFPPVGMKIKNIWNHHLDDIDHWVEDFPTRKLTRCLEHFGAQSLGVFRGDFVLFQHG